MSNWSRRYARGRSWDCSNARVADCPLLVFRKLAVGSAFGVELKGLSLNLVTCVGTCLSFPSRYVPNHAHGRGLI